MKKLISLVLCVVMLASLACLGASAATDGTAINTAEEFAAMKADGNYYLNADIAINATYMEPFTGTFDGNGHTVTVTVPMFAQFDGTVKDLTIDGVEITGAEDLAAFTVYSQTMTAINVTNKVDITVTGITADASGNATGLNAGGIVANTWKDTDCMIVLRNCKNYGKITVASDINTATDGKDPTTYAGGLAGCAYGLDAKFCENHGDIDAFASPNGSAGGIVGGAAKSNMITTCHIEFCTNEANIKAGLYAGGIIGTVGASGNETMDPYTVHYCTVLGDMTGSYEAGGFIGYAYATSGSTGAYIEVTNSIYVGTIYCGRAAASEAGKVQYAYSSLFVAYSNSCFNTVQNCLAVGEIKTLEGETFEDNHRKVFMGCSSAKTPDMPIENVFLCDNNTTEWYSWASAEKNASQQIKLEEYLGTKITRCTEDEVKSGAILTKLNTYAGEEVFVQTAGTDLYPTINPALVAKAQEQDVLPSVETTTEPTTTTTKKDETTTTPKGEDDKTTTPEPTPTTTPAPGGENTTTAGGDNSSSGGCGSVVALSLMALLIPAAVVVVKKKEN